MLNSGDGLLVQAETGRPEELQVRGVAFLLHNHADDDAAFVAKKAGGFGIFRDD